MAADSPQFVTFNYAPYCDGDAIKVNCACEVLFSSNSSVLIVGEGNHTFATGLAARRRDWINIYVSHFPERELPNFQTTVADTASQAVKNLSKTYKDINKYRNSDARNHWERLFEDFEERLPTFTSENIRILMERIGQSLERILPTTQQWESAYWNSEIGNYLNGELNNVLGGISQLLTDSYRFQVAGLVLANIAPQLQSLHQLQMPTVIGITPQGPIDLHDNQQGWLSQKVDARQLPMFVLNGQPFFPRAVVFQCPYDHERVCEERRRGYGSGGELAAELFVSVRRYLSSPPDYIFIGIENRYPYTTNYDLAHLLGHPVNQNGRNNPVFQVNAITSVCSQAGYEFLGVDVEFPKEILLYGYKHILNFESDVDMHEEVFFDHAMLCFRRKDIEIDMEEIERGMRLL